MKSVGETMAIGRTFKEALQKGMRGLEVGVPGLGKEFGKLSQCDVEQVSMLLRNPNSQRLFALRDAFRCGMSEEEIYAITKVDPWFIRQIGEIVDMEDVLLEAGEKKLYKADNPELPDLLRQAKRMGFSDRQLGTLWNKDRDEIRALRKELDILPTYSLVDTCAAEFEAYTPYYYSTYGTRNESTPTGRKKIMILGGGPNRIGQGIEFDYCCCHASFALRDMDIESIMVNSNPETVSTDYDTSDKLYFEPLTLEDVLNIIDVEQPDGIIVQFGGQTPLNLAMDLMKCGAPIIGTSPDSIDRAEDRERFQELLNKLGLRQPANGTAKSRDQAQIIANRIGYPVVVRPSYVLGGRAMEIVWNDRELEEYFLEAVEVSPSHPILVDKFLEDAIEVDVDALSDGEECYVAGVMEHIEEAGIHSGDSACVIPPHTIGQELQDEIHRQTGELAKELRVVGLMNIQFAIKDGDVYLLEVNPRASRTVPFVSKATGVPLANLATQVMCGKKVKDLAPWTMRKDGHVAIKEAVFPFSRFPGVDILLGPEMRSTGEVMGIDTTFGPAFTKSQNAAGQFLPTEGTVFISVNDHDKAKVVPVAKAFFDMGFRLMATRGSAMLFVEEGIPCEYVLKVYEGRPNIADYMKNGKVDLVINTASGKRTMDDSRELRRTALLHNIPYTTTLAGARAIVQAIGELRDGKYGIRSLQEYYANA